VGGNFERGDLIEILDAEGRPVARGLSAYGAADARRIAGHKSREIERILGYRGRDELVHRDDLVLDR
jgi:glutamate 5-kinase